MRPPAAIVYQGVRYVRAATPHARCKPNPQTGELNHWNEKRQQCRPLDPQLRNAISSAHSAAYEARTASRTAHMGAQQGRRPETMAQHHTRAIQQHTRAAEMHKQVALRLYDAGFHETAHEHRRLEHEHQGYAAAHHAGRLPEV